MSDIQIVKSDALIIGGGSAGCMAAIRTKEENPDLQVTILEKGVLISGGALVRGMDGLNIVAVPGISTPEEYVASIEQTCEGVLNQQLCYCMAKESFSVLLDLEKMGVQFLRNSKGQYHTFQIHSHGRFLVPMNSPNMKEILAREVRKHQVNVIERTMATRLLTYNNRVIGATGFNIRNGELSVYTATSTILTTGPAGRFGLPSTGYLFGTYEFPGNAGDGYSMAYRAGAELTGFEYTHPMLRVKDFNGPLWYVTLPRGGHMVNAHDELLTTHCDDAGDYPGVPIMKAWKEIQKGNGPIFLKLTHLSTSQLQEIKDILFQTERPTLKQFFEGRDIDLQHDRVEIEFTEPGLCGGHGITGLVVDVNGQTSLQGLFAAGDVAAVPLQHLTGALVFGGIIGRNIAHANSLMEQQIPWDQVNQEQKRVTAPLLQPQSIALIECEYKLRRIVNEYIASPKSHTKLSIGLNKLNQLRTEIMQLGARDAHEVGRIIEIQCIADCIEMAARASLLRTESRWGMSHFRYDYPKRDDEYWLNHIIIKRDLDADEMLLFTKSVNAGVNGGDNS
jgi:succinate dehydrogenase/fumarate reductase flavoprotein subunit